MTATIKPEDADALIVVDVQNCFLPGGSLGVSGGGEVIPLINRLVPLFRTRVFTRDWHPKDHCSFTDKPRFVDLSWPEHCVQDTPGAEFGPGLAVPDDAIIVSKGSDPDKEAYSGFQETGLADKLNELGVKRVFVGGLATDYCVKFTAIHAIEHGFETFVITDASRGVDVPPGSAAAAEREMEKAGARLILSTEIG